MTNQATGRPPLVLIPQYFGSLVFDRRTSRYMPFDPGASAVLGALARGQGIAALCREHPAQRDALRDFYDYFYRKGFFTLDGRLAADVLDIRPPADHLAGPLAVHLEIIAACNLTCNHCFAGVLPRNKAPLAVAEMDDLFAQLARMGALRLGLTGGEPLLRRDVFDIIDAATERGLHPCITTNGLLVTEQIAREFGKRELVWLNVSLDGATAATNDAIRGSGTFERVCERLRVLGRHARFTLAFTVMSHNAHEVEACARLARELGAHTAVFRPMYPTGVGLDHMELMPTFAQYSQALVRLQKSAGTAGRDKGHEAHEVRKVNARSPDSQPFGPAVRAPTQARIVTNNGCGAGNLVASVSVKGDVNPCSFLGPAHDAGNIRETPFADIWHRSQVFGRIRNLPGDRACRTAAGDALEHGDKGRFRGGCRARALAFGGHIDAADPWHDEWLEASPKSLHPMSNVEV